MNIKDIKRRIKEVQKELIAATGIIAVKLEMELDTLVYLMEVKGHDSI